MTEPQNTPSGDRPEAPAPEPTPLEEGSWVLSGQPSPHGSRRRLVVLGAAALVLALVAGFVVLRPGGWEEQAQAQPLLLSFRKGDEVRYRLEMTMDGSVEAESMGVPAQDIVMEVAETLSWRTVSVDDDGIATIEVAVDEMSGEMNGVPVPSTDEGFTTQMRVAPDGRILSAGGVAFNAPVDSGVSGFPGMGQMTPLLPDHPVAPGDSWEKGFSQKLPFGKDRLEFTTSSTLLRYEDVDGVRAAVVRTQVDLPLDFTFEFGDLLESFGGQGQPGAEELARATMAYEGGGRFSMTTWIAGREMLRSRSAGTFDMTVTFSGMPEMPNGASFRMEGKFTQALERL